MSIEKEIWSHPERDSDVVDEKKSRTIHEEEDRELFLEEIGSEIIRRRFDACSLKRN